MSENLYLICDAINISHQQSLETPAGKTSQPTPTLPTHKSWSEDELISCCQDKEKFRDKVKNLSYNDLVEVEVFFKRLVYSANKKLGAARSRLRTSVSMDPESNREFRTMILRLHYFKNAWDICQQLISTKGLAQ